jgi:hypothetical protein
LNLFCLNQPNQIALKLECNYLILD